ncbi:MAG TPA: hypothetical protein VJ743_16625 [Albitalea sp.]|nr:hypothetical protein [Albitalea sp.]
MLNSETLEVVVGMAFLFLFVSLICTAVKEWLEGIFKWRALDLERALRALLADADGALTGQLLAHPLLASLYQGNYDPAQLRRSWLTPGKDSMHVRLSHRRGLPSYIPAGQFAAALLDCVARGPMPEDAERAALPELRPGPLSAEALREGALALASPALRRVVLTALDHAGGDLSRVRGHIEQWFNGTMDRASGWYKRRTQAILFMLGLAIAAVLNIDAIHIMRRLTVDKAFREVVVKEAAAAMPAEAAASAAQNEHIANARQALERVGMPVGWRDWAVSAGHAPAAEWSRALPVPRQLCQSLDAPRCERAQWWDSDWWLVLWGWLATAFAVMLGAPFWFDVLNKFMVIRSTVKPHEKSPEEGSEDRARVARRA